MNSQILVSPLNPSSNRSTYVNNLPHQGNWAKYQKCWQNVCITSRKPDCQIQKCEKILSFSWGQAALEDAGIDPATSRMLSERSTIWANPPTVRSLTLGPQEHWSWHFFEMKKTAFGNFFERWIGKPIFKGILCWWYKFISPILAMDLLSFFLKIAR